MPDCVDKRFLPSTRRTRGERGLPLYRSDNLPATALATKTMLERQYRMRPAADQQPVAEYYATRDYYDLYAIDDAERMPELSPARKAAWHKVHTWVRCGQQQHTPYRAAGDRQRYCHTCWPLAADDWWTSHMDRAQQLAIDWAREVLADTNAVIANCAGWPFTRLAVVDVATGEVLHDLTTMLAPDPDGVVRQSWQIEDDDPRWEGCTPLPELAEIMTSLTGRRIVSWTDGLKPIAQRVIDTGAVPSPDEGGLDPSAWNHADYDEARRWCGYWLSESEYQPSGTLRWASTWATAVTLRCLNRDVQENDNTGEHVLRQCMHDLATLRTMASGPPTQEHRDQARRAPARSASMCVHSSALTDLIVGEQVRRRVRDTGRNL